MYRHFVLALGTWFDHCTDKSLRQAIWQILLPQSLSKTSVRGIYRNAQGALFIDKVHEGARISRYLGEIDIALAKRILQKLTNEVTEAKYFPERAERSLTITGCLGVLDDRTPTGSREDRRAAHNSSFGMLAGCIETISQKCGACFSKHKDGQGKIRYSKGIQVSYSPGWKTL